MNEECRYIIKLAETYKLYDESSDELFQAINNLPEDAVRMIYEEYGVGERNFQPVNLLRAEVAREILSGNFVNADFVERIKNIIRQKDSTKFPHLPEKILKQWAASPYGERGDLFRSWKRDWTIFHTFFFRGDTKKTVRLYLEEISARLLEDLQLPDYKAKWFDFSGTQNFGATLCWLVLTPKAFASHKDAYQFFMSLDEVPLAGIGVGTNLTSDVQETEEPIGSYEDALHKLKTHHGKIISLNERLLQLREVESTKIQNRKYFKFAPGEQASQWERFKAEGIAALNFSNLPLGDISIFNSREAINLEVGLVAENLSNETWNLWLFKTASVGDVVFASKGTNVCLGIGIIESDYYYEESADGFRHRRKVRWITDKHYRYETRNPAIGYKVLFRFDTFSPTKVWQFILSEYTRLYPELKEVFDRENLNCDAPTAIETDAELESSERDLQEQVDEIETYNFATDADKPFISAEDFYQAVELLKRKKNIILQGSPGVGKTFIARKLAYQIIGRRADAQIAMVQFHQSFAYEDFIQGLRLVKDGTQIKSGVFYNFCKLAGKHPEKDFFFIIDEINRGNLSKVFGELMMLIEPDKRDEKYALKLTYAEDEDDKFFVPPNVYLIGTMNTADRSLAIVDYALRRRFAFVTLEPQFGEDFRKFLQARGASEKLTWHICQSVDEVNRRISGDPNLGAGFQIGHSYFCDGKIGTDENQWFQEILNFEILPLLEEIWFDDRKQIDEMIGKLNY